MQYLVMVRFPNEESKAFILLEVSDTRGIVGTFDDDIKRGWPFSRPVALKIAEDLRRLYPDALEVFLRVVT